MLSPVTLSRIRNLLIDIDGVLWHGKELLPGVADLFAFLASRHFRFVIATNNAARPVGDIISRFARIGIPISRDQVLTSAQATAMFLPRILPKGSRVLVVGGPGLAEELSQAGYSLVDNGADAVVAGLDPTLTYDKLKRATQEIRKGAKFVGTNGDKTFPGSDGLAPGAGAILAAIQAATDTAPLVIGKPERAMFDVALENLGGSAQNTAMLGDRLDTDIEGAKRAGLTSILVMTGVTTPEILNGSPIQPDMVFPNLPELLAAWNGILQTY